MARKVTLSAVLMALTLMLSGAALAHDYDDDDHRGSGGQARRNGYQQGYNDGFRHGRDDREDRRGYSMRSEDWEHADRGYANWMGPFRVYQSSYRDGYSQGYEAGYRNRGHYEELHGYGDRDDWGGRRTARETGYHDGRSVAQEDRERGKPFNPNPRGKYDGRDHGYRREFGDKNEYREQYSRAYREGYESVNFRR